MEREVITELIELYRGQPCLWDMCSEEYKNTPLKTAAWNIMAEKLKEIEPDANVATVKKKIDHLRSSYKREVKKVSHSKKQIGISAKDVHKPSLWYYKLMTFLDGIHEELHGIDRNEKRFQRNSNKRKSSYDIDQNKEKIKIIEVAHDLLKNKTEKNNSFGTYVGEQMEQLTTYQRQVAERLISEVIFLAKTESLNFDSRVETPSKSNYFASSSNARAKSPDYILPITHSKPSCRSYQSITSSPSDREYQSPQSLEPCSPQIQIASNLATEPTDDPLILHSSPQTARSIEKCQDTKSSKRTSPNRDSTSSLLKELLVKPM